MYISIYIYIYVYISIYLYIYIYILALRANFVQLLQFHGLFSIKLHFGYCLHQSPCLFYLK